MRSNNWPEPKPIEECKAAVGEHVLCYLFVPQKNDGMWCVCCRSGAGIWFTDMGDRVVPSFFVPLPPKIAGLKPLDARRN